MQLDSAAQAHYWREKGGYSRSAIPSERVSTRAACPVGGDCEFVNVYAL